MPEPKDEKDSKGSQISNGLIFGMLIGTAIGVATDNLALWIGLGMALGVAFAAVFSQVKKEKLSPTEGCHIKKGRQLLASHPSGEGGIRTRDTFRYTRFPSERTRPTMRPLQATGRYYIRKRCCKPRTPSGQMPGRFPQLAR